jgi:hypothetical protein
MREQPIPHDALTLTRVGMASWVTNVMVAQKFAQAFSEQTALITRAMRGRPLVRPFPFDDC